MKSPTLFRNYNRKTPGLKLCGIGVEGLMIVALRFILLKVFKGNECRKDNKARSYGMFLKKMTRPDAR
jgi:hypothetical protein